MYNPVSGEDFITAAGLGNEGLKQWFADVAKSPLGKTAGVVSAAGLPINTMGLFDNNKVLTQLGGAALGFGLPLALGGSPVISAMTGTAGGALGALLDKLRAKRAEKRAAQSSLAERNSYANR